MKYAWIDAQRREYPLPDMCEVLAVSISGYRAWGRGGKPDRTRLTDPQADLRDASRRAGRSVRVHRGLLQPEAPPLHAGLQLAGSVPGELDRQVC